MSKSQQNLSLDDKNLNNTIDLPNSTNLTDNSYLPKTAEYLFSNPSTVMKSKQRNYRGKAGRDWVVGNNNDNIIYGRGGHDILIGAQGNDTLLGGAGNDILNGAIYKGAKSGQVGKGEIDFANGGRGSDIFIVGDEYYGNYYADSIYSYNFSYSDCSCNDPYLWKTTEYRLDRDLVWWQDRCDGKEIEIIDEGCLIIQDFSVNNDKLQLVGSKEQYYTKEEYTQINSSYYEYGIGVYDVKTNDLLCFIEDSASTPSLRSAGGGKLDLDKIAVFI